MRSFLLLIVTFSIVLVACQPLEAKLMPTFSAEDLLTDATIEYYDVSGFTEDELRSQLDALGPVGYDGYQGDATTRWDMSWNWPVKPDGTCQLSEAVVSYQVTVVFPRWNLPEDASTELVGKWQKYTQALAEHEKGHIDIVLENVQKVEDAIKGATCETADAVLSEIREQDQDYDTRTDHGSVQGARLK